MNPTKAGKIAFFSFSTPAMRAFHAAWVAFFLCFFSWFSVAPLMGAVRADLGLTKQQIGNTIIASVAVTVLARLVVGWLCDRIGPRRLFSVLLVVGALPVMGIGLADSYETFLVARLLIGAVGASFVIAQFHTSLMFGPRCVGTANAITAGWGNLGGGVTQAVMPALFALGLWLGFDAAKSWRLAMLVPGFLMIGAGIAYYRVTRDSPAGDLIDLRRRGALEQGSATGGSFRAALRDYRVWVLFLAYAACFGVELTTYNVTALYFTDEFGLSLQAAGLVAAAHGGLNLFARALGGVAGDRAGNRFGLNGRAVTLACTLLFEGAALLIFSQMRSLWPAVAALLVFSLFVQMACGATFALVPFVNRRALGSVSGIVGAGGNVGAVLAGFLFRAEGMSTPEALLWLGVAVTVAAAIAFTARFAPAEAHAAEEAEATGAEVTLAQTPLAVPAE